MTPVQRRPLKIILDPGHGSVAGGLPGDPGAIGLGITESRANLILCLTLKWALVEAGHTVLLTRTDERRPRWEDRTKNMGAADLYLSVHHDSAIKGRSMAYYAAGADYAGGPNPALSRRFADCLDGVMPDPEFIVLPDTASRHGRLYIRGALAPVSVMWEVDPVHVAGTQERIDRAKSLLNAIELAVSRGLL